MIRLLRGSKGIKLQKVSHGSTTKFVFWSSVVVVFSHSCAPPSHFTPPRPFSPLFLPHSFFFSSLFLHTPLSFLFFSSFSFHHSSSSYTLSTLPSTLSSTFSHYFLATPFSSLPLSFTLTHLHTSCLFLSSRPPAWPPPSPRPQRPSFTRTWLSRYILLPSSTRGLLSQNTRREERHPFLLLPPTNMRLTSFVIFLPYSDPLSWPNKKKIVEPWETYSIFRTFTLR